MFFPVSASVVLMFKAKWSNEKQYPRPYCDPQDMFPGQELQGSKFYKTLDSETSIKLQN